MPPKRARSARTAAAKEPPKPRRSALAKELDITADQEASIREAFSLFAALSAPGFSPSDSVEGFLSRGDVRRCLIALNLRPASPRETAEALETLDPTETGYVAFGAFAAYAALLLNSRENEDEDEDDEDDEEGDAYVDEDAEEYDDGEQDDEDAARHAKAPRRANPELDAAFALFTHGAPGPITLPHLRRVARELREDVSDEVLRDMIVEANGGVGGGENVRREDVVRRGVGRSEFARVMRRAGVRV